MPGEERGSSALAPERRAARLLECASANVRLHVGVRVRAFI